MRFVELRANRKQPRASCEDVRVVLVSRIENLRQVQRHDGISRCPCGQERCTYRRGGHNEPAFERRRHHAGRIVHEAADGASRALVIPPRRVRVLPTLRALF